jgi:ribose 1,5-bisphosphokinase
MKLSRLSERATVVDDALPARAGIQHSRSIFGPGVVVLVVGPSGAGKDALLRGAAAELQPDTRFVFPKRIISRPVHAAEAHDPATHEEMTAAARAGAYALSWQAHGLIYGVASDVVDDGVHAGKTVVFNTSRTVVAEARKRFQKLVVLYIDAPREVRAARLAMRGRETTLEIAERLARDVSTFELSDAEIVISNDGNVLDGVDQLVGALKKTGSK